MYRVMSGLMLHVYRYTPNIDALGNVHKSKINRYITKCSDFMT